jgi:hypothetical protein
MARPPRSLCHELIKRTVALSRKSSFMLIISFLPTSFSAGSSGARRPPLARAAGRRGGACKTGGAGGCWWEGDQRGVVERGAVVSPAGGLVTKRAGWNSLEGAAGMEPRGELPRAAARVSAGGIDNSF